MKKNFLISVFLLICSIACWSIPARSGRIKVTQPDGTQLTIELHGDEYRHFTTTADGYTVVKAADGFYYYAVKNQTELLPSQFIARDAEHRTAAENLFLSTTKKRIMADMTAEQKEFQQRGRSLWGKPMLKASANAPAKARYDYSKFKGLIVLIEWSDRSFARENTKELFEQMVNQAGYTGYQDDLLNQYVSCTGSVTDYFSDNSEQIFQPQFDIVGPVKVNYTCTYPNGGKNLYPVINSAFQQLDPDVNFADYDVDKDGRVDMVYFIFAGYASSSEGNDSRYVWPHASTLAYYSSLRYDNKRFGRYACSTEFDGFEANNQVDLCGIGTICHEFSHVLGLADHYDADYEDGGGQSYDPGTWDIMAGGSHNNNSRTPAGYNAYERYTLGFLQPIMISQAGNNFSLSPINTSNMAYRLNTPVDNEYFLIENRQKTRWDSALPGHGMLVWRVDSTEASVWQNNTVNNDPTHNYFVLIRANPSGTRDTQKDPFPGYSGITALTNDTQPANLLTWAGSRCPFIIYDIKETGNIISFKVNDADSTNKGDLDNNGTVNIADIVLIIDVMSGENTDAQTRLIADITGEGDVNIADIIAAIDLMIAQSGGSSPNNAPAHMPTMQRNSDYITARMDGDVMSVGLDNTNDYTAFQMTVTLPEGAGISDIKLDESRCGKHTATLHQLNDRQYLVAVYSLNNKKLNGCAGKLFTLDTERLNGEATISDVIFATPEATPCLLDGTTVMGTATGIDGIDGQSTTYSVYDLQGRRTTSNLSTSNKGVYIVNGKKVIK